MKTLKPIFVNIEVKIDVLLKAFQFLSPNQILTSQSCSIHLAPNTFHHQKLAFDDFLKP